MEVRRSSSPRWELDIVAYKVASNELLVVECKSFLDSRGVSMSGFGPGSRDGSRYKLFNDDTLREVVFRRLRLQLFDLGLIAPNPNIRLCLVAGRTVPADRHKLQAYFEERNWTLWTEEWIKAELANLANQGYENDVATVVAKLLR